MKTTLSLSHPVESPRDLTGPHLTGREGRWLGHLAVEQRVGVGAGQTHRSQQQKAQTLRHMYEEAYTAGIMKELKGEDQGRRSEG